MFSEKFQKNLRRLSAIYGIPIKEPSKNVKNLMEYIKFLEEGPNVEYVKYKDYPNTPKCDVKPIAFYLPQFYNFPENDEWHGRGFTEWTNATKAKPLYTGHYQPHLPIDLGFYNLENNKVFKRQIELAKNYGIFGFAFHYYWFSGKRLMEKPIFNYLNDKSLDFPFCLCWPCENWSKLWDGGNKEILVESVLRHGDVDKFWEDLLPFISDSRYIKFQNKPVLIIYRSKVFDPVIFKNFALTLKEKAIESGFEGLYLINAATSDLAVQEINYTTNVIFDAFVEFPPHGTTYNKIKSKNVPFLNYNKYINSKFKGFIFDFKKYIEKKQHIEPFIKSNNIYRTVFPMWDNSPRKARTGCYIFEGATPEIYKKWLADMINWTKQNKTKDEQYVFINAWNEWGEGAHLEPDSAYGYAFLDATREVLDNE